MRIYEKTSSRFHLSDCHLAIDGKLKTFDDLYQPLKHDQASGLMVILEANIVLLFFISQWFGVQAGVTPVFAKENFSGQESGPFPEIVLQKPLASPPTGRLRSLRAPPRALKKYADDLRNQLRLEN